MKESKHHGWVCGATGCRRPALISSDRCSRHQRFTKARGWRVAHAPRPLPGPSAQPRLEAALPTDLASAVRVRERHEQLEGEFLKRLGY